MNDQKHQSNSQGICEFLDEDSLITGGKSVSEIIQMLRTNAKFKKIVKGCDDNEDKEEQSRKLSFPWMTKFGTSCKEVISNPSMVKLDILMSNFLKNVERDVKQCSKKPKRAHRLRIRINPFLLLFNMIYWYIKKPLEHTTYLDRMSDIMALFIDVELKSSRICRENPKKISQRICSSLHILLDKSMDHILDAVLKATFFNKSYSEICVPVMARLLKKNPGKTYEATYVRYLLAFKLWKKLAGKDQCADINKLAIAMLKPPPNFADKLKSGLFANVLPFPYVSKKESLTHFFMRSPFNVKEKAQLFLKDVRKLQPSGDFDKTFVFDEDFKMEDLFDKESQGDENGDHISEIWNGLIEKEMDPVIELLDSDSMDDDDDIVIDIKKNKTKEKLKRANKNNSCSSSKMPMAKKRKLSKSSLCIPVKNVPAKEPIGMIKTENKALIVPVSLNEDITLISSVCDKSIKKDDRNNLSVNNNAEVQKKPCATVEPKQTKEVEPDSHSVSVSLGVSSAKHTAIHPVIDNVIKDNTASPGNLDIIVTPKINETIIGGLVDSTSVCEKVKIDTNVNAQTIFDVDQIFKDKGYEQPLLEEVAEEVTIQTEISQDEGSSTLLVMDSEQVNLNHQDIMNVIGIPKNSTPYNSDSGANDLEFWKKTQELIDGSLLKNQCNSLNTQSKLSLVKNQPLTPTINDHQLALYSNGSCLLDQRPDHYVYNDMKITTLLSAENGDEGSDDENRCTNNVFSKGGKFPAFRGQITDESKSEGGDESEVNSPASQSDSTNVETSPESATSQPRQNSLISSQDSVQESKSELKSDKLADTRRSRLHIDPSQLPEVSVSLAYMTDIGNLNDYHANKEKSNSKGMCSPPDSILHFKTVDRDIKFYVLQQQLYTLYNTTENILDSDPVPIPPTVVVASPINGDFRCPCSFCNNQFAYLVRNYKFLFDLRNFLVCQEVDKTRMISKFYHTIEQTKLEDDKLLKSIEETMPPAIKLHQNANPKGEDPENISKCISPINVLQSDKLSHCESSSSKETKTVDSTLEQNLEDKSGYSSLPPKKRRAFSMNIELGKKKKHDFENENQFKDVDSMNRDACILKTKPDPMNAPIRNNNTAVGQSNNACSIKPRFDPVNVPFQSSNKGNGQSKNSNCSDASCAPINIPLQAINTAIEQSTNPHKSKMKCASITEPIQNSNTAPEPSRTPNTANQDKSPRLENVVNTHSGTSYDTPVTDERSSHGKCRKHHRRSKEERRLKKERKRLKRQMREENSK